MDERTWMMIVMLSTVHFLNRYWRDSFNLFYYYKWYNILKNNMVEKIKNYKTMNNSFFSSQDHRYQSILLQIIVNFHWFLQNLHYKRIIILIIIHYELLRKGGLKSLLDERKCGGRTTFVNTFNNMCFPFNFIVILIFLW